MPCTPEAVDVLRKANVLVAPSMAAGVGGVWHVNFAGDICMLYDIMEAYYAKNNFNMYTSLLTISHGSNISYLKEKLIFHE